MYTDDGVFQKAPKRRTVFTHPQHSIHNSFLSSSFSQQDWSFFSVISSWILRKSWFYLLINVIIYNVTSSLPVYFVFKISLAITGMNAVCPVFFKLISLMEQYHPRVALYWELTRYFVFLTFFLNILYSTFPGRNQFSRLPILLVQLKSCEAEWACEADLFYFMSFLCYFLTGLCFCILETCMYW